jgi:hypothetical protein
VKFWVLATYSLAGVRGFHGSELSDCCLSVVTLCILKTEANVRSKRRCPPAEWGHIPEHHTLTICVLSLGWETKIHTHINKENIKSYSGVGFLKQFVVCIWKIKIWFK